MRPVVRSLVRAGTEHVGPVHSLTSEGVPQQQEYAWQENYEFVRLPGEYTETRSPPSNRAVVAAAAATRRAKRRWTQLPLDSPFSFATSTPAPPSPQMMVTTAALPRSATRVRHSALPQAPKPPTSGTTLSDSTLLRYERDGFVVTRRLLPTDQLASLRTSCEVEVSGRRLESLRHRVRVLCPGVDHASLHSEADLQGALDSQATDSLGFLQFFNLHRTNHVVRRVSAVSDNLLEAKSAYSL